MKYPVIGAVIGGTGGFFIGLAVFYVWNVVEWPLLVLLLAYLSAGCCAILGGAAGFLYWVVRAIRHLD